jgi:DNA-directed RNA polymerase subunit RPC12/RpoP
MSSWDDFIYCGEDPVQIDRKRYLKFCLQCGDDILVDGPRYKVREVKGQALLLQNTKENECPRCKFPIFTSCHYKLLTKKGPIPGY